MQNDTIHENYSSKSTHGMTHTVSCLKQSFTSLWTPKTLQTPQNSGLPYIFSTFQCKYFVLKLYCVFLESLSSPCYSSFLTGQLLVVSVIDRDEQGMTIHVSYIVACHVKTCMTSPNCSSVVSDVNSIVVSFVFYSITVPQMKETPYSFNTKKYSALLLRENCMYVNTNVEKFTNKTREQYVGEQFTFQLP